MTDLAQIALEFCRECLGWANVREGGIGLYVYDHPGASKMLHYGDLNAVMGAVQSWRDKMQEALGEYVTVTLSCASGQYIGHAFIGTAPPTMATADDPCRALLAACLAANRTLGGGS